MYSCQLAATGCGFLTLSLNIYRIRTAVGPSEAEPERRRESGTSAPWEVGSERQGAMGQKGGDGKEKGLKAEIKQPLMGQPWQVKPVTSIITRPSLKKPVCMNVCVVCMYIWLKKESASCTCKHSEFPMHQSSLVAALQPVSQSVRQTVSQSAGSQLVS